MFDLAEIEDNAEPLELYMIAKAFARIRGAEGIESGAILSRNWLAADMGVEPESLDRRLRLLRWQGLIDLDGPHLVVVKDAAKMKAIAVMADDHWSTRRSHSSSNSHYKPFAQGSLVEPCHA